jgi:hypothetical protein
MGKNFLVLAKENEKNENFLFTKQKSEKLGTLNIVIIFLLLYHSIAKTILLKVFQKHFRFRSFNHKNGKNLAVKMYLV